MYPRVTFASRQPFAFILLIAVSILPLDAQDDQLCDFDWYSKTECPARLQCAETLDGQVKTVPANVTRISEDGLSLCLDIAALQVADIVYIMDMSGSMHVAGVGGDPMGRRPAALQVAFDYHVASTPQSTVGYIGFAGGIATAGWQGRFADGTPVGDISQDTHFMRPAVAASSAASFSTLVSRLQSHITRQESLEGTNYRTPLDTAIAWFSDNTLTPNWQSAIVFFSDGRPFAYDSTVNSPYPTQAQIDYLVANNIAVYGIFMGGEQLLRGVGPTELRNLSQRTGGLFYEVHPDSAGMLARVMSEVVEEIATGYTLTSLSVTGGTTTASMESYTAADSVWSIRLDRIIPLVPGANTVSVRADFTSDAGNTSIQFATTLDVSGPADHACFRCRPRTVIEVLDVNDAPIPLLTPLNTNYKIRLTYYGFDTLATVTVAASTVRGGDAESILLPRKPGTAGPGAVYETMVNFTLPAGAAPGNGATEAGDVDVLAVRWAHPVDLRDTAVDSVDVLNDIEGPYVTEAYYYLGDPYDLDPANPDTLVVIFNERFVCAQTQAVSSALSALYNYTSKDPSVTEEAVFVRAVLAACASDTVTRLTVILGPDNGITPLRDSIAVKAGQLVDLLGNPSVDKPPAVIRYGRDYSWTSRNAPNPFQPAWGSNAGDQIPPAIIGSLDQTWVAQNNLTPAPSAGTVVEVISIKNPDLIQSNMLVLDALGNVVADRLPAYPVSNNPNKFYFFWDGYNRNRRVVGSGTYLARIFVYAEGESTPGVKQQKIGVRN